MFHQSQPDVPNVRAWQTHSVPVTRMTPEAVYQAWREQCWRRLALSELGVMGPRARVEAQQSSQGQGTSFPKGEA
jgi:hypothetical protein